MALKCFTCWNEILNAIFPSPMEKEKEKEVFKDLPDHAILEILSRVPAEQVLKCRAVCGKWKALTSTPSFLRIHLERASASPIVFAQHYLHCPLDEMETKLYFLDEKAKDKKRMIKEVSHHDTRNERCHFVYTYNGLIILASSSEVFIINPVTQEEITLRKPQEGSICGFYFHSLKKEYRLLYVYTQGFYFHYYVGSPKAQSWRYHSAFTHRPRYDTVPTIVNGFLYWIAEFDISDMSHCRSSIMTFSTRTEEFQLMRHPGDICSLPRIDHGTARMQLVPMVSDQLLFCRLYEKEIKIWVLEDASKWIWSGRYNVDLNWGLKRCPLSGYVSDGNEIKLVNVQDGELLLFWSNRGLFRYHLQLKTIRKIEGKIAGKKMSNLRADQLLLATYTKSLESSGFKSIRNGLTSHKGLLFF